MEALRQTGDLERLIHRIETPSARPRDLASLRDSSFHIEKLRNAMGNLHSETLAVLRERMDDFSDLRDYLEDALVETPPVFAREGGVIREGFSPSLTGFERSRATGGNGYPSLRAGEGENRDKQP